jgi:hypothetical protein
MQVEIWSIGMDPCDEFETSIEARLRAALDLSEEDALTRHVASCPTCGGYLALAQRTNEALFVATREALPPGGWDRLRAHTTGVVASLRWSLVLTFALSLLLLPVVYRIRGAREAFIFCGICAVMLPLGLLLARRKARDLSWAERSPGDLLQFFRDEMGARTRERSRRIITLVMGLCGLFALVQLASSVRADGMLAATSMFYIALLVVLIADFLFMRLVLWPRAERELEALG